MIIPESNVRDLVLKEEVVEAVRAGMFHIYPIRHVEEGIELLMGMPAGKKGKNGKYPIHCIHALVLKKLREFHKKASLDPNARRG